MQHIAHISEDGERIQSVGEHTCGTAKLCAEFGRGAGLENFCFLCGIFHDAGKLTRDFTEYILGENNYGRGDIDHAFAGAKYLHELCAGTPYAEAADLAARVIISHHGLHDWYTDTGRDYFAKRVDVCDRYSEIKANIGELISGDELEDLLKKAAAEYRAVKAKIKALADTLADKKRRKRAFAFYMGLMERYVQSVLVDADRCDTAAFMANNSALEIGCDTSALWQKMDGIMQAKCEEFRKSTDKISRCRMSISERCAAFADRDVGVCRLVVPTGGGKTLSSLRFAIKYAMRNGSQKIIYVAPFMSILEQNSGVISEFVESGLFTEHYSDALAKAGTAEELNAMELRCERLDAPVIVTTFVQFLNSLFLGSMAAVRRFHRLENSVMILDEVQSLPLKCVYMFDLAVNFLSKIMGCTVVLCTATQPSLEALNYPVLLDTEPSMTGDFAEDFENFKRTEIIPALKMGGYTFKEAADFCIDKLAEGSLLLVVNTKKAAAEIYSYLQNSADGAEVVHLSTNMCPQHRRDMTDHIREALSGGKKLICVSTQLIEAGVDISFGCTVRSLAGLDNIAQAAGRCNRNGERESANVYVINIVDENLDRLQEIKCRGNTAAPLLEKAESDILGNEMVASYFHKFYNSNSELLKFPTADGRDLLDMLSLNEKSAGKNKTPSYTNQAFATAGRIFEVIDNDQFSVCVPYNDEACELIADLGSDISFEDFRLVRRKLQKYTVGTYYKDVLVKNGALVLHEKYGIYSVAESYYSQEYGLVLEDTESLPDMMY